MHWFSVPIRMPSISKKKTILLKRWDRSLFAEGVVILAFEDLLTPQRRMVIANRAMNLSQATVNVREIAK